MIPKFLTVKNGALPDSPGVYFYYDTRGTLLYIGKATSLKKRVGSYFMKAHDARIGELVLKIARIDYVETPTVIEALVLEANKIRAHQPPYNVLQRDDKSFLYLCVTREDFPKPVLFRGLDLERIGVQPFSTTLTGAAKKKFLAVYGPYVSGRSLRTALDLVRKTIPWSVCDPSPRACFDAQIGKCPGVCTGAISKKEYRKIIRHLMLFFSGKKGQVLRQLKKDMHAAAKEKRFEDAAQLRNRVFALEHIQDTALIFRDDVNYPATLLQPYPPFCRIEAYDIAHTSGTSATGAMVVFESGEPVKSAYRKFRIKSFEGNDDVRAMGEVIERRLRNMWPLPDLFVIDGGEGQVNAVRRVLDAHGVDTPIVGIAKGFDRKQDRLVYEEERGGYKEESVHAMKEILQRARDEAHRFAGAYHKVLRSRRSGI